MHQSRYNENIITHMRNFICILKCFTLVWITFILVYFKNIAVKTTLQIAPLTKQKGKKSRSWVVRFLDVILLQIGKIFHSPKFHPFWVYPSKHPLCVHCRIQIGMLSILKLEEVLTCFGILRDPNFVLHYTDKDHNSNYKIRNMKLLTFQ